MTKDASIISTPTTMSGLNSKMLVTIGAYGSPFSYLDTKTVAFETANGESILTFYNPHCVPSMNETSDYYTQPKICVNFVYDLNGNKGPNTVGKDIGFMTVLYPTDSSVVMPLVPNQKAATQVPRERAIGICKEQDPEFRIPSLDELASMFVNQQLIGGNLATSASYHWSSTLFDSTRGWTQGFNTGARILVNRTAQQNVHCVKR